MHSIWLIGQCWIDLLPSVLNLYTRIGQNKGTANVGIYFPILVC